MFVRSGGSSRTIGLSSYIDATDRRDSSYRVSLSSGRRGIGMRTLGIGDGRKSEITEEGGHRSAGIVADTFTSAPFGFRTGP